MYSRPWVLARHQTLFSMLDQHMQPKAPVARDPSDRFVEFSVKAEPVCGVLGALLFEQLYTGCGWQWDPSLPVGALDTEMLWRHVQDGLGKILHCCRGGGLKVQIGYEPSRRRTFFDMRRQALYAMAGHLTALN